MKPSVERGVDGAGVGEGEGAGEGKGGEVKAGQGMYEGWGWMRER